MKLNGDGDAEYCYRLIGLNFPKSIDTVTTRVHVPGINGVNSASLSNGKLVQSSDSLLCATTYTNGVYKLRINMKSDSFNGLGHIVSVDVPDGFSQGETSSGNKGSSHFHRIDLGQIMSYSIILFIVLTIFAIILINIIKSILNPIIARIVIKKYRTLLSNRLSALSIVIYPSYGTASIRLA